MSTLKSCRIKLGNKCNNNCLFCKKLEIKLAKEKSLAEIRQELTNIKKQGCNHIILPCNSDIRADIFQILNYAKGLGFIITLETNGRMFFYKQFVELAKPYLDEVIVRRFGKYSEMNDRISQVKDAYDQSKVGETNLKRLNIPFRVEICYEPLAELMFDKPLEVVIETTPQCNFDCKSCFNKASFAKEGRSKKEMSTEFIKEIIDDVANSFIPKLRFSGGEPLLREDIFELMAYAKSKNLIIWLNTNATLVTEDNVTQIEKYVENILIPLNGYDSETDSKWTKTRNSFEDKIRGLKLLKKSKIEIVRAGTILTKDNLENLEKIYQIVKDNKLDFWEVYRPIPLNKEDYSFDAKLIYNQLIKFSLDFGRPIQLVNPVPFCIFNEKKMDSICLGACFDEGNSRLVVDPAGFAKPSYFIHENLGNPTDIMGCWNHEFMKKMRGLEFVPKECQGCDYVKKCKGGSRYAAKLYFDDYQAKDPLMRDV